MSKLMSFRIPKETRDQLEALAIVQSEALASTKSTMTMALIEAVNLLWILRASDDTVVAQYGTVSLQKIPSWNPFWPPDDVWAFTYHPHFLTRPYLSVDAAKDAKSYDDAIRHYARYWRQRLVEKAVRGRACSLADVFESPLPEGDYVIHPTPVPYGCYLIPGDEKDKWLTKS